MPTVSTRGLAVALIALLASLLLGASTAAAQQSKYRQVITKVHTDAFDVAFDDDRLTLGAAVDAGAEHQELDPALTVFNVEQAAKGTVPDDARYRFLGAPGADVWIAPQSNPENALLWPGVSSEEVPAGALDRDEITFSVEKVSGPGTFDLFSVDGLGTVNRLLTDRGTDHRSWTIRARQHIHANWAFSAAGTYILRVTATAQRSGRPVSATADYRFQVGYMPDPVRTTTSLTTDKAQARVDEPVTFTGKVEPAGAPGWIELRTRYGALGHTRVAADGTAELTLSTIDVGHHEILARFVPEWGDDYTMTVSDSLPVDIGEDPAAPRLRIEGGKATYAPGETLSLSATGVTPAGGQRIRWRMRNDGYPAHVYNDPNLVEHPGPTYSLLLTRGLDGYQFVAELMQGDRILKRSEPLRVQVAGEAVGSGVPIRLEGARPSYAPGEYAELRPAGDPLPDGHAYRLVLLNPWSSTPSVMSLTPLPDPLRFRLLAQSYDGQEIAAQRLDGEGRVVGQSPSVLITAAKYEVGVQASKPVYKPGDVAEWRAVVTPDDGRFTRFTWYYVSETEFTELPETSGTVRRTVTAADKGAYVMVLLLDDEGSAVTISQNAYIDVEQPIGDRALALKELAHHYHSGETITVEVVAEALPENPVFRWFIKRTDETEFVPLPFTAAKHTLRASQSLDGALIHAQLIGPGGEMLAQSPDRTIAVSDHGDPPNEVVTITGLAERYRPGETITLAAVQTPATSLDRYEWLIQRPGQATPSAVPGVNGSVLTLPAESTLDGARVFARLTRNTGQPYVTSSPATLTVGMPATVVEQPIGGTVGPVLALELGTAPRFGTFVPGLARTYTATSTATVTSTLRNTHLTVADTAATATGHLVNGESALATPLRITADGSAFAPLSAPVALRTFARPVSGEPVALAYEQMIGAREGIEAGAYAKTLTFTLSTSTP